MGLCRMPQGCCHGKNGPRHRQPYTRQMKSREFPRRLIAQLEDLEHPLACLEAVRAVRQYLALVEEDAIRLARGTGASVQEIGRALGMTRQGVSYRLKGIRERHDVEPDAREPEVLRIPDLEPTDSPDSN